MYEGMSIGETSDILGCPIHQVRRTVDEIWPELPRIAGVRIVPRSKLCELAAAIERRFGKAREAVSS